ncbi:hypothetical protein QE443_004827 [Pantoea ananatis]|jgi:hypothetical protein|nr:hypothetical protein [Pantoea ananatis]MDR6092203.1 hypothetical protein [Pantoea ananatis]PWV60376.1 hypothetical protein C7425_11238 [Pantoea ananatis]PWV83875.1 hypothetical protein C7426_11263 [Pantoea ananatis]REC89175.1 hypothetical protein C7423_11345 [Pantoea ananatis]
MNQSDKLGRAGRFFRISEVRHLLRIRGFRAQREVLLLVNLSNDKPASEAEDIRTDNPSEQDDSVG